MNKDLENRLDAMCESLELQKNEFEEAAKCCVEAIQGMNQRIERIEKWMIDIARVEGQKTKALT